jgi:hypothetical protein
MIETSITSLEELQQLLASWNFHDIPKVFVGFDGFIDKIKKAVKHKRNATFDYYKTIPEFASRIQEISGRSGQIELVTQRVKLGGNGPILSNALGKFGVQSTCIGSIGYPQIHPVFSDLHKNCQSIGVLNPGESEAIEFDDGKIILSELSIFDQYDWNYVKERLDLERIRKVTADVKLMAFVDWVNLPHSSLLWEGFLNDVIKPSGRMDFVFLFDLCDPSKKSKEEIDDVLHLISRFSFYGKVTLGLNENETLKIWSALNRSVESTKMPSLMEAGEFIFKTLNIDCLLIHPVDRTIVFHKTGIIEMQGRVVMNPKVLTGGGDNLNAGFILGLLTDLPLPQRMLLAMAASGAYVENGVSPCLRDIENYLVRWKREIQERNTTRTNKTATFNLR